MKYLEKEVRYPIWDPMKCVKLDFHANYNLKFKLNLK